MVFVCFWIIWGIWVAESIGKVLRESRVYFLSLISSFKSAGLVLLVGG